MKVKFDDFVDIATGLNREQVTWKNKQWLWSELLEKFSKTTYTSETFKEYLSAKREIQDKIKDVGGFIGGYLNNGRRKADSVIHRQLLTLDMDYGNNDAWEDFKLQYDFAAAVYSTHKHSADTPRFRLIIPLDREVSPDEFKAISRHVADKMFGIDLFDSSTSFKPSQLMYWPSTSKDGLFFFDYQDGPWLSADEMLATYTDWKDSSSWPMSSRETSIVGKAIKKQGDPLDKPGIVGAFCRTYNIHEVMEVFLSDVYDACDAENRYSYKEGSTSGGLVVYEDKYAYSHHGTDPISGKLCNAFDLVRIHLFGLQDEDVRESTPINKLPSYLAMSDRARQDPQIRKILITEKLDNAKGDFADVVIEEALIGDDDSWKEKLDVDRKGNIFATIDNVVTILSNDDYFKGKIAYDDFEKCEVAIKDLPWRKISIQTRRLIDKDDANIRHYLEKTYGISSAPKVKDAMEVISTKTSFHPVRDYLNKVKWDGEKRVDRLLIDYQGAEDSEYTKAVTRKILVAAVTRVFKPGAKFDYILVLVGKQGLKKSSLISKLGKQWFSDSFSTIKGKESFEQLQGVWLVEIAELAGLAKAEIESIKHFITKRDDRYRVAFGRRTETFPRQCVFFATTNKLDFLRDPTGDRRYWPVVVHEHTPVKEVFTDLTDYEIDQVWAEAVDFYKKGEKIFLNPQQEKKALEIQKRHTEEHPWSGIIRQYLGLKVPEDWQQKGKWERVSWLQDDALRAEGTMYRSRVCVLEIWVELGLGKGAIDERSAKVIHDIMRNTEGWQLEPKPTKYGIYGVQRNGYFRAFEPDDLLDFSVTNTVTQNEKV